MKLCTVRDVRLLPSPEMFQCVLSESRALREVTEWRDIGRYSFFFMLFTITILQHILQEDFVIECSHKKAYASKNLSWLYP